MYHIQVPQGNSTASSSCNSSASSSVASAMYRSGGRSPPFVSRRVLPPMVWMRPWSPDGASGPSSPTPATGAGVFESQSRILPPCWRSAEPGNRTAESMTVTPAVRRRSGCSLHGDLFIDAAEDAHPCPRSGRRRMRCGVPRIAARSSDASGGGHGNAPYIARGVLFLHVPQRVEHRLAAHHHARSPPKESRRCGGNCLRNSLMSTMSWRRALVDGAGHDRGLQKALEAFREDGQNGDLHGHTPFLCGSAFYLIGRPHRMQEKTAHPLQSRQLFSQCQVTYRTSSASGSMRARSNI